MDAYKKLYLRTAEGIKPGLEVISEVLNHLNNPHHDFAVIHIAGTNGKGSVSSMIESVLRNSGFKTGLFTSPHLVDFTERYRIDGKPISKNKLNRLIISIEKSADDLCKQKNIRKATFFEISTAIAFQYFSDEDIDIAVIETGMGGRWDATNIVIPILSVITNIGIDHTDFLGNTLSKIAREKSGIIKKGHPVVSAPQKNDVKKILELEDEHILYSDELISIIQIDKPQKLKIETTSQNLPPINLPLYGEHQRENCSVAVLALEKIGNILDFQPNFKEGLEKVKWPGRFMKISNSPPAIIDGAHNSDAANKLIKTLKEIYPKSSFGFIVGFLEDKDQEEFMKIISDSVSRLWVIPMDVIRGKSAESTLSTVKKIGLSARSLSVRDSWNESLAWANEENKSRLIVVTGSLRLVEIFVNEEIITTPKLTS